MAVPVASEQTSPLGSPLRAQARRELVRPLNHRRSAYAVFALVAEDIDFTSLGLRHGTQARILLEKLSPAERQQREPKLLVTTTEHGAVAAADEAHWLAEELRPWWQMTRGLQIGEDLGRLMTDLILSMPTAVRIKDRGGLYMVAVQDRQRIEAFQQLIAALPSDGEQPWCVCLPVIDELASRRELAGAVHRGFLAELQALQSNLADLRQKSQKVGIDTVAARLAHYRAVQQRAIVYADLLGMQRDLIETTLNDLRQQARDLVLDRDVLVQEPFELLGRAA